MKKITSLFALMAVMAWASIASAHMFWVNTVESFNHPPGHVTSVLGFGHMLPLDDLLTGEHGVIKIDKYQIINPDMSRFDMDLPDSAMPKTTATPAGLAVQSGDLGIRKISLGKETKPGTYQIAAQSKPMFLTKYINDKGKLSIAPMPMDKLNNAKDVLASFKYQSYAKSLFSIEKWEQPKALGHELEIIPLSDMSSVQIGDLVRFKVLYKGKPVTSDGNALRILECNSNTFGGPDGFYLAAYVLNGEAQFRMPAAGQWVTNIYYKQNVNENASLKALKGKCKTVFTAASLCFNVKP